MASMSTLGAILPASAMAIIIAVIVFIVVRIRSGEPLLLSFRSLFTAYFYLMCFVSFIILALGLSILIKAGFGGTLGREFSYHMSPKGVYVAPAYPEVEGQPSRGKEITPEERAKQLEREKQRIENEYRTDIIQGATAAVVGGLIWVIHLIGRRRVEDREDPTYPFYNKAYLVLLLAVFAIAGIIALVIGIYDTLRFYLLSYPEDAFFTRPTPGRNLAAAIVFVPVWIYYVLTFMRQSGTEG